MLGWKDRARCVYCTHSSTVPKPNLPKFRNSTLPWKICSSRTRVNVSESLTPSPSANESPNTATLGFEPSLAWVRDLSRIPNRLEVYEARKHSVNSSVCAFGRCQSKYWLLCATHGLLKTPG